MADTPAQALMVAIRAKCMDCSGNSRREVERCKVKNCPLYPFRNVEAVGGDRDREKVSSRQIKVLDILATREELKNFG